MSDTSRAAVEWIVTNLVDDQDKVSIVDAVEDDGTIVYEISVASEDMGRLIGRKGRTAKAIRTVIGAISDGQASVDIVD